MILKIRLGALIVVGAWILTGCGGGAPSTVQLSGTAAKGILIGANVSAYVLTNGQKGSSPLATTLTKADGSYTLDILPTNNPVLIEVRANATTMMLDETQLDGDKFKKVKAPINLVMRSFALEPNKLTNVRVNPFTEMAVAVAEGTGSLTLNSLIAGQQMAELAAPEGVNPFTQTPVSNPEAMNDDQLKFALLNAGLLSSVVDSCDLQCQIEKLSEGVMITLQANGQADWDKMVTKAVMDKKKVLVEAGSTSLQVNSEKSTDLKTIAASLSLSIEKALENPNGGTTQKPEEVIAANGLQGFIDAMRDGFNLTESRLLKLEDELDQRYKNVTLEGVSYIGSLLDEISEACTNDEEKLVCTSGLSRGFKWTPDGAEAFNWVSTSDNDGRTSIGKVVGSIKNGVETLTVNGRIVKDGKNLVTMTGVEISLLQNGDDDFRATLNGTLQAMDSKDLVVTLNFEGLDAKSVPRSNSQLTDLTFKGGLSIEASNGDKLTGSVDLTFVEVSRKVFNESDNDYFENNDQFITYGVINLKAVTATANVLALDVTLKTSMPDYTKPESNENYETSDGTVKLALTDSLFLTFTEKSSQWDTVSQVASIKSGTSEIQLTAEFKAGATGKWCLWSGGGGSSAVPVVDGGAFSASGGVYRCASELKLISTNANPYNATLISVDGKTVGDVFLGLTKVGEFVNGSLTINGIEVSIY